MYCLYFIVCVYTVISNVYRFYLAWKSVVSIWVANRLTFQQNMCLTYAVDETHKILQTIKNIEFDKKKFEASMVNKMQKEQKANQQKITTPTINYTTGAGLVKAGEWWDSIVQVVKRLCV